MWKISPCKVWDVSLHNLWPPYLSNLTWHSIWELARKTSNKANLQRHRLSTTDQMPNMVSAPPTGNFMKAECQETLQRLAKIQTIFTWKLWRSWYTFHSAIKVPKNDDSIHQCNPISICFFQHNSSQVANKQTCTILPTLAGCTKSKFCRAAARFHYSWSTNLQENNSHTCQNRKSPVTRAPTAQSTPAIPEPQTLPYTNTDEFSQRKFCQEG